MYANMYVFICIFISIFHICIRPNLYLHYTYINIYICIYILNPLKIKPPKNKTPPQGLKCHFLWGIRKEGIKIKQAVTAWLFYFLI
jgi:hypothetical protein